MDHNGGLTWIENGNGFPSPLDSRPSFGRNPKGDLDAMGPDVAMKFCRLPKCQQNEVFLKSQSGAESAWLNGRFVSDGNWVKPCDITVFTSSVRFENQDLKNFASLSDKDVTTQDTLMSEKRLPNKARRKAPGKRKLQDYPLREIAISPVKNQDRSTKQLFCRRLLQANNRLCVPLTLEEKKPLQVHKLVKCQSRTQQMSLHRKGSDETSKNTAVTLPTTSFKLDLLCEDLTQTNELSWRPVARENKGSTVQTVDREGEVRAFFRATPGDCAPCSNLRGENILNEEEDLMGKEQAHAMASITVKTPSTPQGSANQLGFAAELFNQKSAEKRSAQRKRFSRRASSVGARGSPETNSLICYIARQRMQRQKVAMLKSKMAGFMDTFNVSEQGERKKSTPEILNLSDSQQTDATSAEQHDCILLLSDRKLPVKKKVTFGGELSPEVFDKSLPSNTPLRKGEMPVCQKIMLNDSPASALKQSSKVQLRLEDVMPICSIVAYNGSSPVNDHYNKSLNLVRKLADNVENGNIGTHNVNEERYSPVPIHFDLLTPLPDYAYESNLKKYNKNDEYPCDILAMKVQELKEELLDTISPSRLPGKENEVGANNVTCRTVPSSKKMECIRNLELSRISIESEECFARIGDLEYSGRNATSRIESDVQQVTCIPDEMLKNHDSQVSDWEQTSSCILDMCPAAHNVIGKHRAKIEARKISIELSSKDVSPKSKDEKDGNWEHEPKKDELRRSTRNKSKVKNISTNSATVTKGKYKQKFKKELYGKREYASRKPVLSPITEIFDIWSEFPHLLDSDGKLECEPSKRIGLLCLESTDIGGESEQSMFKSECSNEELSVMNLGKITQRPRRPRKRSMHYFEEEQSIQTSVASGTQKGTVENVGVHQNVPKKLNNNLTSGLVTGSDESSLVSCENPEYSACGVKAPESSSGKDLVNDDKKSTLVKKKSSKKNERKFLYEEFPVVKNSHQGITGLQILFEGQCPTETGLEECIKETSHTSDCNCFCSFLEPESKTVENIDGLLQTEPDEMKELTPFSKYSITQESHVIPIEPLIVVPEQKVCILPPGASQVFQSRSKRRNSKLFRAAELACEKQSEQATAVNVGGYHIVDANSENRDQAVRSKEGEEKFSDNTITKVIVPSYKNCIKVSETLVKDDYKTLIDNSGHYYSLEPITNIIEAADQFEIGIKYSNVFTENSVIEKKKVRRSARLSGFVNIEGLSWIESTSPDQLEEKNKSSKLTRKSLRLCDPRGKPNKTEEVESKTDCQTRIRVLSRKSLLRNSNIAIEDLEEPPEKSIIFS
ncbi:cell division cycle-associated protein 2 isoform X2 [Scyliorhinus torazame]|uniref:cell division cycle-associated protein 2 isoform X2 n=1 Tax=Scyliorhinus torazame TaxID=75743 RepID=UPI003B58FA6B